MGAEQVEMALRCAGGKFVWGGVMDGDDVRALDPKDPNYDSEQEGSPPSYGSQPTSRLKAYKAAVSDWAVSCLG